MEKYTFYQQIFKSFGLVQMIMPMYNISKVKILAKEFTVCRGIASKTKGLMFSEKKTLVFVFKREHIISLHMFFVFFPIDVIFLDKKKIVVDIKENFRPFTFYKSRKNAFYVIELNYGIIKKTKTQIGDKIKF